MWEAVINKIDLLCSCFLNFSLLVHSQKWKRRSGVETRLVPNTALGFQDAPLYTNIPPTSTGWQKGLKYRKVPLIIMDLLTKSTDFWHDYGICMHFSCDGTKTFL